MALETSLFGALASQGRIELEGALGAEVALSRRVGVRAQLAAQRWSVGGIEARDAQLAVPCRVVARDDVAVTLMPGLSLPLGATSRGIGFDLVSTGSFDPTLAARVVYGGAWVASVEGLGRLPLYAGADLVRQGFEGRVDARGARRFGWGVPWVGASVVGRLQSNTGSGGFVELAPVAGVVVAPTERLALQAQARVPVWTPTSADRYLLALGLTATVVLGARPEPEEH